MAQGDDEDGYEPVFKKSKWGTSRYVYNVNNPLGLALTVGSLLLFVVFMVLIETKSGPFEPPKETPWSPPAYDYPSDFPSYDSSGTPSSDASPSASESASPSASPSPSPSESASEPETASPSPTFTLNDGMRTPGQGG